LKNKIYSQAFGPLSGYKESSENVEMNMKKDSLILPLISNKPVNNLIYKIIQNVSDSICRDSNMAFNTKISNNHIDVYNKSDNNNILAKVIFNLEKQNLRQHKNRVIKISIHSIEIQKDIKSLVVGRLSSIREMNNAELEQFLDSGDIAYILR
jgi:hypothetical protein